MSPLAIDLTGRRAIVTGAGKGIGRAIGLDLARAGADVFGVSRSEDERDLAALINGETILVDGGYTAQ